MKGVSLTMKRDVLNIARKFLMQECGNVSKKTLVDYLRGKGYEVIFCNLQKGNATLERLNLTDYAKKVEGFTCLCDEGKYVFIHNIRKIEMQLMTLAHEVGHVVLRHLEDDEDNERNRYVWELEADTFAYVILRHQKMKRPHKAKIVYFPSLVDYTPVPNGTPSK